jgi:hypothetical protein
MLKKIKIETTIFAEDTELGVGAIVLLEKATPPIIKLLKREYEKDPRALSGDIKYLYKNEGSEPIWDENILSK